MSQLRGQQFRLSPYVMKSDLQKEIQLGIFTIDSLHHCLFHTLHVLLMGVAHATPKTGSNSGG